MADDDRSTSDAIRKADERAVENIILVSTPNLATGRAVLRELDDLEAARATEVRGAALLERAADGRWYLPEETEKALYRGRLTVGAIGALTGLLAAPAGQLLGGGALLMSSSAEIGDAEDVETILLALGRLISPGTTAVVCDVYETSSEAIDGALAALGLSGWRMTRDEAEAQLNAALHRDLTPRCR